MSYDPSIPLVVAYGGGVNSTAMLCGFRERGIKPDLILFADTGGEMPHTYEHIQQMDSVCREWFGIGIETVKAYYKGEFEGLEKECLRRKAIPSLAYGFKTCSQKHKIAPQTKRLKLFLDEVGVKDCTRAIGYDAGESHRQITHAGDKLGKGRTAHNWFALIEWNWRRNECIQAILRHNLSLPEKSACFFCPAMKRAEIINLKDNHPGLYLRALTIEANAVTDKDMGLTGRNLRWADIGSQDDAQGRLWEYLDANDESPIPCGCFDG